MPSVKIADQWLRTILSELYGRRNLTRSEILEATGLNAASVSHTLRYVLNRGLLLKVGEMKVRGGRRREVFSLNTEAGYFIAVDLEGDHIRFALTNFLGDVRCRWEEPLGFRQPLDPRKLIDGIGRVVRDLENSRRSRVLAMGVSYPGLLDSEGRLTAVNLGWTRFPLVNLLKETFPWPLFLEHDKHSCVLAECWHGAAQNYRNALFLIAEGGIGLGILVDGKPLEGAREFPGEIGHWKISPEATDLCNCGQEGCLEAIASSPNIVRQYLERSGRPRSEPAGLRVTDIFEKARQQDPIARAVLERAGRMLGLALSHAIGVLNPEIVILGGDIISAEDILLPVIRDEIERRTLPLSLEGVKITVSQLGLDVRLKGAASLAFREMLEDPKLLRKVCASALPDAGVDRDAAPFSTGGVPISDR
jgi:predicted NBD/HSP70 family sugar kinase